MRVVLIALATLSLVGCENRGSELMLPPKEEVLPEVAIAGNVFYYVDTISWTGGEGDPSGFILTNPNWLSGEPNFTYSRIYLKDSTLGSLAGSRVRITGTLDTIWAGGIQTPRRSFPWIGTTDMTVLMKPEYFPNQVGTQWTYEVFDPYVQSYFSMVVTITDTTRVSPTLLLFRWHVEPDSANYLFISPDFYVGVQNDIVEYYYYWDPSYSPLQSLRIPLPLSVGMQWDTGWFQDDSATVESFDSIQIGNGIKLGAFRIHSIMEIPNSLNDWTRWLAPYAGLVKFEGFGCYPCVDLQTWTLIDYRIGQPDTAGFR